MRNGMTLAMLSAAIAAVPAGARAQSVDAGQKLFQQRCQMCHSVTPGAQGVLAPNLYGIDGRKAASTAFAYSNALKNSGIVWDRATLDAFLANPSKLVPGTRMVVAVPNPEQRAQIVAYLLGLKPKR